RGPVPARRPARNHGGRSGRDPRPPPRSPTADGFDARPAVEGRSRVVPPAPPTRRPAPTGSRHLPARRLARLTLILLLGVLLGGTAYWTWAASYRTPAAARTAEGPRPSPAEGQAGSSGTEDAGDAVARQAAAPGGLHPATEAHR